MRSNVAGVAVVSAMAGCIVACRRRMRRVIEDRDALARQGTVISAAVRELTTQRRSADVVHAAVRLAAELISPSVGEGRRAVYLVVEDDTAQVIAEWDESGPRSPEPIRLSDHPALRRVVETRQPARATFAPASLGPTAQAVVSATQISHGAAVPIVVAGRLHGILAVGGRGRPIAEFDRLIDLGNVVELALANALVTEDLVTQATTDPLTGCANRRALEIASQALSNREPFAVVSIDLDGLKLLNDREGHDAGDAALRLLAGVLKSLVRTGDMVARVGGDEFLVLLHNTDSKGAAVLAERILTRIRAHPNLRLSLGIASAADPGRFDDVCRVADQAMYRSKRLGGMRYDIVVDVSQR